MLQRLWRLCLVAILAAGAFTVSDTPVKEVDTAAAANCTAFHTFYHSGGYLDTYNFASVKGLTARLHSPGKIQKCLGSFPSDASAWIAVVPDEGTAQVGNNNAILQIGFGKNSLEGNSASRIFMALGGCGQYIPNIQYRWGSYTPGSSSWITFRIWVQSNGDWAMDWSEEDPNQAGSPDASGFLLIDNQDPAISCWINSPVRGMFSGETKNPGNDVGFSDAHLWFRDIKFRASVGGTWWMPAQQHSSGLQMGLKMQCDFASGMPAPHQFHCDDPGTVGDKLDVWMTH